MFRRETPNEDAKLLMAIDELLSKMLTINPLSDDYAKCIEQLTRLYALKEDNSKKRVSADTLAVVLGNLAGIVLIVGHERAHVVTSKAIGFVLKAR